MIRALAHAGRQLGRSPGFTFAAVVSLALGIGANTAMFSLIHALLLKPLGVREPARLVQVGGVDAQGRVVGLRPQILDQIRRDGIFDGVCGFVTPLARVEIDGHIAPRTVHAMTGECLTTLGVAPVLGRLPSPDDDLPGAPYAAVITYDAWQRHLGGRPDVLNQQILVEGHAFPIVGVTEPGFTGVTLGFPAQVFFPLTLFDQYLRTLDPRRAGRSVSLMFARLKPGDSIAQVHARLSASWPRLLALSVPEGTEGAARDRYLKQPLAVRPAGTGIDFALRDRFERPLLALLGIAAVVLLVSCVNVANLLLARAAQRRHEAAVRLALGASRATLIRSALLESLLLVVLGIGAGLLVAHWSDRLLLSMFGAAFSSFELDVTPEPWTLAFTVAVAAVSFLLFALAPAWRSSRSEARSLLVGASTRVIGERSTLRRVLVVAQVALTLTLVTGAVLFSTVLSSLRGAPLGLELDGLLNAQLAPMPGVVPKDIANGALFRQLLDTTTGAGGVQSAALASMTPLFSRAPSDPVSIAGDAQGPTVQATQASVTDHFLQTMGIDLIAGSDFRRTDTPESLKTAIISESLARRLFASGDPIGRQIQLGQPGAAVTLSIVGVAKDAVINSPQTPNTLVVYRNFWRAPALVPALLLRSAGDPRLLADPVRRELQQAGQYYPVRMRTMLEERDTTLSQERLLASLSTAFGTLGLVLAAIGLYGLLSFSVVSRTSEIGVRMALGARRSHVVALVLREALTLMLAGVAVGLPITWAATSAVRALLHGAAPFALAPVAASIAVLLAVGTLAAWIPAHRAASIQPRNALQHE